jgi:hypothetical protein
LIKQCVCFVHEEINKRALNHCNYNYYDYNDCHRREVIIILIILIIITKEVKVLLY